MNASVGTAATLHCATRRRLLQKHVILLLGVVTIGVCEAAVPSCAVDGFFTMSQPLLIIIRKQMQYGEITCMVIKAAAVALLKRSSEDTHSFANPLSAPPSQSLWSGAMMITLMP